VPHPIPVPSDAEIDDLLARCAAASHRVAELDAQSAAAGRLLQRARPAGPGPRGLRTPAPVAAGSRVVSPPGRVRPGSRAILVVDDEDGLRAAVAGLLADDGHAVRTAPDGRAALARLAEAPADLVIADVMMPRLGGHGLVAAMRAGGNAAPVLMISGGALTGDGAPGVTRLAKPFAAGALQAAVAAALA